jgi:hypothetical protein
VPTEAAPAVDVPLDPVTATSASVRSTLPDRTVLTGMNAVAGDPARRAGRAVTIPIMAAAYQGLRPEHIAQASRPTRIVRQVGGSFGTAVVAVILQRQTAGHAAAGTPGRARAFGHTF